MKVFQCLVFISYSKKRSAINLSMATKNSETTFKRQERTQDIKNK